MRVLYLYSFFFTALISGDPWRSKARFRPVPLGLQRRCGREPLGNPWKLKRSGLKFGEKFVSHRTHGLHDKTFDIFRHDKAVQFDVLLMIYIYIQYIYIIYICIYIYILDLVKGRFCSIWNFSAMARSKLLRKPKLLSNRLRIALRFFSTEVRDTLVRSGMITAFSHHSDINLHPHHPL